MRNTFIAATLAAATTLPTIAPAQAQGLPVRGDFVYSTNYSTARTISAGFYSIAQCRHFSQEKANQVRANVNYVCTDRSRANAPQARGTSYPQR